MGEGKTLTESGYPLLRDDAAVLDVLRQARGEKWKSLALVSTELGDVYADYLAEAGCPREAIFRVTESLGRNLLRELCALKSLEWLSVVGLKIDDEGAKAIAASLTSLTFFNLGRNQVGDEGAKAIAASLTSLTFFNLWGNQVGDEGVKAIAASLTSLTYLNLGSNQVGDEGTKAIAKSLKLLTSLNLWRNQVGDEGAKAIAASLTSLTSLNLWSNQVGDEGAKAIAASLTSLTSLDLQDNQIGDDGAKAIAASLTSLTSLDLGYNQVGNEGVRALAASLTSLTSLDLGGNPITEPSEQVIRGGVEAIRAYFAGREEQGTARLFEAKVLFVGEPAAGKTSLMNKLVDPTYELEPSNPSTLGIDIESKWSFAWRQDPSEQVRAHLWDFGGQNIQYYIHQFFLTERSLYILVHNARQDAEHIEYWFNIIELLGTSRRRGTTEAPRCPVLVVSNEKHIEGVTTPLDETKYRKLYPELDLEFLDVDLSRTDNDDRLKRIRNCVEKHASELPHLGEALPAGWVAVRQRLEEQQAKRHIRFSEFQALCESAKMTREADQRVLAKLLHDLGVILWYQEDPKLREIVFLDPVWVTRAMYTVLADKDLGPRFSERALFTRWAQHYTAHEKELLLQLMQKHEFDLCYELEARQGRPGAAHAAHEREFLVPQLLGDVAPEQANRWPASGSLRFQYRYAFMPMGIVTRLGVRLSDCIVHVGDQDLIWKSGFILESHEARARVVQARDRQQRQLIDVSITGPRLAAQQLLGLIRAEVERVHRRSFRDVDVEQLVPCCCVHCENADEPTLFTLSKLETRLKHRDTIDCTREEGVESPSIRQLLEGVVQPDEPRRRPARNVGAHLGTDESVSETELHNPKQSDRLQDLLAQARQPIVNQITVNTNASAVSGEPKSKESVAKLPWHQRWQGYAAIMAVLLGVLAFLGIKNADDLFADSAETPQPPTDQSPVPLQSIEANRPPSNPAEVSDAGTLHLP